MNYQSIPKQDIRRSSITLRAGKTSQSLLTSAATRKESAFTLTDLLAVVATLAILGVLVFPAFGRTKHQSNDAICKNNLRQLTQGCLLYADESRGVMPWAPVSNTSGSRGYQETLVFAAGGPGAALYPGSPPSESVWAAHVSDDSWAIHAEVGAVFPYVTGQKRADQISPNNKTAYEVYRCPSTGIAGKVLRVNYSENKFFNPGLTLGYPTDPAGVATSAIVKPVNKVLLAEAPTASMKQSSVLGPIGSVTTAITAGSRPRHLNQDNLSYSDGHVETVGFIKYMTMFGIGSLSQQSSQDRWWIPQAREY